VDGSRRRRPRQAHQQTGHHSRRVTGPDTLPIPGGPRQAKPPTRGALPSRQRQTVTAGSSSFFVNGEGDYWLEISKLVTTGDGSRSRRSARSRSCSRRAGPPHWPSSRSMRSTSNADNRALVNRNSKGTDVSGSDKALVSSSALLPPDRAGKPRGDGVDSTRHSADSRHGWRRRHVLGTRLSGNQNNTTFTVLAQASARSRPTRRCGSPSAQFPADRRAAGSRARRSTWLRFPGRTFRPGLERLWHRARSRMDRPGRRFLGAEVYDRFASAAISAPDPDGSGVLQRLVFGAADLRRYAHPIEHQPARTAVAGVGRTPRVGACHLRNKQVPCRSRMARRCGRPTI